MHIELHVNCFTNRCRPTCIRFLLELNAFDQTQHIENMNKFKLCYKDKIVRIFTQRWKQDIERSSKLHTYGIIEQSFCELTLLPPVSHILGFSFFINTLATTF